jgi:hypothetical protein
MTLAELGHPPGTSRRYLAEPPALRLQPSLPGPRLLSHSWNHQEPPRHRGERLVQATQVETALPLPRQRTKFRVSQSALHVPERVPISRCAYECRNCAQPEAARASARPSQRLANPPSPITRVEVTGLKIPA